MKTEQKPRRFPLSVGDDIHAQIEAALMRSVLKSKHQWIEQAIQEKIERDNRAV